MNKIDVIFKWVSIILLFLTMMPILSFFIYLYKSLEVFIAILFVSSFIGAFLIPIGNLILIVVFFIKFFSKNKTGKNDEQLVLNLINIIFYSLVSLFCIAFLSLMFISDGINS